MNAVSEPLLLIDTPKSGNAWKVRLLCAYLDIAIRRQPMSIVDGDLNSAEFAAKNPLQMVPVLQTQEGEWLSESAAILWYLAKGTDFLPEDRATQARIVYWLIFEQTQHMVNFAQPRLQIALRKLRQVTDPDMMAYRSAGHQALRVMEQRLSDSSYLAGSEPTIADVALFPYTEMAEQGGYELTSFPHVNKWLGRMRDLPGYVPLIPTE